MIPLNEISLVRVEDAEFGDFLFSAMPNARPRMLMREVDDRKQAAAMAMEIVDGRFAGALIDARASRPRYVRYANARVVVDPKSVVAAGSGDPGFGTLLIGPDGPSVFFQNNHVEVSFSFAGKIDYPDWQSVLGFQRWRVELPMPAGQENISLFEVSAPPR